MIDLCSWDNPGADRYTGTPAQAMAYYRDVPADVRARLVQRMERLQHDGPIVVITKDAIRDDSRIFAPEIRDMHFGAGKVCAAVSRAGWKATHREYAFTYCEASYCFLVPFVCTNISRIELLPIRPPREAAQAVAIRPVDPEPGVELRPVIVSRSSVDRVYEVPEPKSWLLTATALLGLAFFNWSRRR